MKIGVLKLGARVSYSSQGTSGGTGEALSIINMLKIGGGNPVVFTKILDKDVNPPDIEFRNIADSFTDTNDIDALLVINGSVNFFGGAEDYEQLLNYRMINEFAGPVFYALCDPSLTLTQVWPSVEKKEWSSKWSRAQLEIVRTDIVFLCQPRNTDAVINSLGDKEIKPRKAIYFPFEKFPCLNSIIELNNSPSVDLSYGGTMRGGKRAKKMVKFYFDHPRELSVEMFGKIELRDFDKCWGKRGFPSVQSSLVPAFSGPVKYDQMLHKMNTAMAHCVIGDPWYEEIDDVAQRTYESIWSSVVTFIDRELDKDRRVFSADAELREFLYVSSREELSEKLLEVKKDSYLRETIVSRQIEAIGFDSLQYCQSFVNQLRII